ncbi:hypothetical protein NP493_5g04010 [Ridgeia piscesae]|uniref:Tyrosine-protein phosphatase non-receptor type 11 n=1 Tax=Ridgeia piscesae TaxID=27915 RepID=A0AAD9PFD5_RIDPI|nr:hypothetical protein NP493_5g04010 [Ridgeia piscesae]
MRIQNTGDYYDLYGGEKFATLAELVEHYFKNWGVLKSTGDTPVYLKFPLLCADPTKQRWFHGQIKGKAAEKMLMDKGKEGSFLVRGSRSNPGDFVLSVRNGEKIHHVMIVCKEDKYILAGNEDGDESFTNLTDLVEHYKEEGLKERNGDDIKLVMPFNATHITASGINDRIKELDKDGATKDDAKPKKGFMEEFDMLTQLDTTKLFERNAGKKPECRTKNRYKNILPFDFNRVVLKDGDPKVLGTDYINANLIQNKELPGSKRQYIATQGCLKTTVKDFWRMIWQHNSRIVVMTTKLVELGKVGSC